MRADLKRGFLFSMMRRDRREERNKGMSLLFAGFQGRFATMLASESEGTEAVTHLPLCLHFLGCLCMVQSFTKPPHSHAASK